MPTPGLCYRTKVPTFCSNSTQLSREIVSLIAGLASQGGRRHTERIPLPFLLELQPIEPASMASADGMVVVGKDLSDAGIGFFHQHRIPHRRVRLRLELPELGPLEMIVEMLWCHFTRQGWYESGARILEIDLAELAVARAG